MKGKEEAANCLFTLDRICIDFEDRLRSGTALSMLDVVDLTSLKSELFGELLLLEEHYLPDTQFQQNLARYRETLPTVLTEDIASLLKDGTTIVPTTEECRVEAGDEIGCYRVIQQVGHGSCGTVFHCESLDDGSSVAIKLVTRVSQNIELKDPQELLRSEAEILRTLDHPNVVPLLELLETPPGPALVFPYFDQGTLRESFSRRTWRIADFVDRLIPLVQGINHAHSRGIVHRDVEPGNILVGPDDQLILGDFGLSVDESVHQGASGESAGSIAYMSPEQVRGESHWLEGRSDIWAIGVILYEAMTGKRPFNGDTAAQISEQILYKPIRPPRQIRPEVPVRLEEICLRCLARDPELRFRTAGDLATALEGWKQSQTRRNAVSVRLTWFVLTLLIVALAAVWFSSEVFNKEPPEFEGSVPRPTMLAFDAADASDRSLSINNRLDMTVYRPVDSNPVASLRIEDPGVLPVRPGDQLVFRNRISSQAHLVGFLVDVEGRPHLIQFESCETADQTKSEWVAPPQDSPQSPVGFCVEAGESGAEMLVCVSSREQLLPEAVLAQIPTLVDQRTESVGESKTYHNGRRRMRGMNPRSSQSPSAENQARIWKAFRETGWDVDVLVWGFESRDLKTGSNE